MVPPLADTVVDCCFPGGVIDESAVPAKLKLKARRSLSVERQHSVVGMPSEGLVDSQTSLEGAIVGHANVIDFIDLEHEVVDPLALLSTKGKRVMSGWTFWARGNMEECNIDRMPEVLTDDPVAQLETQKICVECVAFGMVASGDDEMAHTEFVGEKSRADHVGLELTFSRGGTTENLRWDSGGIEKFV